jgi:hypothetical protein
MDADSGRSGPLGRDDSGIFHFSDYRVLPDEMRRPVSSGMRYAPNDRRALKHKIKETGDEED